MCPCFQRKKNVPPFFFQKKWTPATKRKENSFRQPWRHPDVSCHSSDPPHLTTNVSPWQLRLSLCVLYDCGNTGPNVTHTCNTIGYIPRLCLLPGSCSSEWLYLFLISSCMCVCPCLLCVCVCVCLCVPSVCVWRYFFFLVLVHTRVKRTRTLTPDYYKSRKRELKAGYTRTDVPKVCLLWMFLEVFFFFFVFLRFQNRALWRMLKNKWGVTSSKKVWVLMLKIKIPC